MISRTVDYKDKKMLTLEEAIAYVGQNEARERFARFNQSISPGYFHRPNGIHGLGHTKRVLFLAELLAALENLAEPDRDIISIASVYHDIGRTHDGVDQEHGYASFDKVERMSLIRMENHEDYATVRYITETHCINDHHAFTLVEKYALEDRERGRRLLRFFKDADGLDRVRINDLNPEMLRLEASKGLVRVAKELFNLGIPFRDED